MTVFVPAVLLMLKKAAAELLTSFDASKTNEPPEL